MKELLERTLKKPPKKKKIRRRDFNLLKDHSLLKRRRLIWQTWM
jgi:hypothetical protein